MDTSKKMAAGITGIASFLWLTMTAAIAANQRRLVFNPCIVPEVDSPRSTGHRTRPVVLRARDGTRLCGWLLTPLVQGPRPAVMYFGGRSEEVSWVARDAGKLFPGMTVLAMNYRGYGQSHGTPDELLMIDDGCTLFDWLAALGQVDAARIAVVGRSLGSGVAVQVAKERPVNSVVLITPYDSILAIAKRRFRVMPIEYMLRHRFESIKHAPSLKAPTYVLRAASDDVVPHSHTDQLVGKLATLAGDDTVPASDHMNIPYLDATQALIAGFLTRRFAQAAGLPQAPQPNTAAVLAEVGPEVGPKPLLEAGPESAPIAACAAPEATPTALLPATSLPSTTVQIAAFAK